MVDPDDGREIEPIRDTPLTWAIRSMRRRSRMRHGRFSVLVLGHAQPSVVSRWESGQRVPRLRGLLSLLNLAATPKERAAIVDALKARGVDEAAVAGYPACQSEPVPREISYGHAVQATKAGFNQSNDVEVSRAVRALRKRLGLTQTELGRKLFVRCSTVYRYEKGMLKPGRYVRLLLWRLAETADEFRVFSAGLEDVTQGADTLRSDETESHA